MHSFQPRCERLEDRAVPATFHVTPGPSVALALAAASPGDTIKFAAGDYRTTNGVIVVTKKLELEGAQDDRDPTKSGRTPAGPSESTVAGFNLQADKIEIEGFTINNTLGDGVTTDPAHSGYEIEDNIFSGNSRAGILLRSSGVYGTEVESNWFDNLATGLGADQWDIRNFGTDGPLSNAEIESNKFSDPSKFGSAVDLEGPNATTPFSKIEIEDNRFDHSNGIFLTNAIRSEVSENKMTNYVNTGIGLEGYLTGVEVTDNDLRAGTASGDGIRLQNVSGLATPHTKFDVEIEDNDISGGTGSTPGGNGSDGIRLKNVTLGFLSEIEDNEIRHMGHDGIHLDTNAIDTVTGATVEDNDIAYCAVDGISLENASKNIIKDNDSDHNGGAGILLGFSSDFNAVSHNETDYNLDCGIRASSTAHDNTFTKNKAHNNIIWDFRDASGPGPSNVGTNNDWHGNQGGTANPAAILTAP